MKASRRAFLKMVGLGAVATACNDRDQARQPEGVTTGDDANAAVCTHTGRDAQGPFYESGAPARAAIAAEDEPGERLVITGSVHGADCETPLTDVLLDVWQADRDGNYHGAQAEYRLRGTVMTDAEGRYEFETIIPGSYEQAGGPRPAHIHFTVSKPGHAPLTTQLYFEGDPYLAPNDSCSTACSSDEPDRIIALAGELPRRGTFNIVLARSGDA